MPYPYTNRPIRFHSASVVDLGELTYDTALELQEFIERQTKYGEGELWKAKDEQDKIERKKREESDAKRKELERVFLPKLEKWLIQKATVGTRFKMKGCRDGDGIRELISRPNADREGYRISLECRQVFPSRKQWNGVGRPLTTIKESYGQITQHMSDKVTAVLVDGQWVPIRQVVT
jgi:hypothetical protein